MSFSGPWMPRLEGVVQGTAHWHHVRIGRITASRVAALLGCGYDSQSEAGRRLTAVEPDSIPDNKYMKHGRDNEGHGVAAYSAYTGQIVEDGGFFLHPKYHFAAASPDGIIDGGEGGLEVKCPYMRPYESVKVDHWMQCQHQIACCGFKYVDYIMHWVLRDDDPVNPKDFSRCWRVYPSKWWAIVAGPQILERYKHCVVDGAELPRKNTRAQENRGAYNGDVYFPRLDEDAFDAAQASVKELFCTR